MKMARTEIKIIDPLEYFNELKKKKKKWNTKKLQSLQRNTETMLQKAYALGQDSVCRKLLFNTDIIHKERKLLEMGIDTFLYKDDIKYYVENVADEAVKITEIANYPREIPDEIAIKVKELKKKKIFDDFLIVYTDYTGEAQRNVEEERKRKDPIIFGIFKNDRIHIERFYYLGDWEDEYCDLTLDKMLDEMAEHSEREGDDSIKHTVEQNVEMEEIRQYIDQLDANNRVRFTTQDRPHSFLGKVRLWFAKQ